MLQTYTKLRAYSMRVGISIQIWVLINARHVARECAAGE